MSSGAAGGGGATSPAASGPAGPLFEAQVGAHYLLTLLAGAPARGLPGAVVRGVAFQRAGECHPLDDVVVHAVGGDGQARTLEIQVKRTVTFAPGDQAFRDVVAQLARAVLALDRSHQRYQYAVAVARTSFRAAGPYQDVLRWARELEDAAVFMARVGRSGVGHEDMRRFVGTVRDHLTASGCVADDETVWEVLRRFQILAFDFAAPGSQSEELALERARSVLAEEDVDRGPALWAAVCERALRSDADGGAVDRARLVTELVQEGGFRLVGDRRDGPTRTTLTEEALLAARDLEGRVAGVGLARPDRLQAIRTAMDAGRYVEILGGPGVGKSGLLGMLVDEVLVSGRAVVLSPARTVAGGWRAFKAELGVSASPEAFLSDLASGGGATLFVDGLDFFEDAGRRATVTDLVRAAAAVPGVRVVVTARTGFDRDEPNWLPAGSLAALGRVPPVVVDELGETELEELRAVTPVLRALLDDDHPARDVARNLFRLSRLLEVEGPLDAIRTEVDLLERWWTTGDGPVGGRRERCRLVAALADAALAGSGLVDASGVDAGAVDELVARGTVRELGLDRIAFEHDVLREWAVAARLREDPARLDALALDRPVPPPLARAVELCARLELERGADGGTWSRLLGRLGQGAVHASWRRWALLSVLRSEAAGVLLDRAAPDLLADGGFLLRELIATALAVESEPLADVVARLGGDATAVPRGLAGPVNASWGRLVGWLLSVRADLPIGTVADVTRLFQAFSASMFFRDLLTPVIAAALDDWLEELEAARDHSPFKPDPPRFSGLRFHDLEALATVVRNAFFLMSLRVPDRARAYLARQADRRNSDAAIRDIMSFRGTLAQAAPGELADLTLAALMPAADSGPDGEPASRRSNEPFSFLEKSFHPTSPSQGPFLELLHASPSDGLRLVRGLVDRAVAWRVGGADPGVDGFALVFPDGPRKFPWTDTYYWSRRMYAGQALESALMALEAWAHARIEGGDAVEAVLADVIDGPGAPAAFLLVAVDLLISHWPSTRDAAVPFLGCPELLCADRDRHTRDNLPDVDLFGLGSLGLAAPAGRVTLADLRARPSRRFALEGLLGWFASPGQGDGRLRDLLEAAAGRLGEPEPGDTFAEPRFMASHALNSIDPANWRDVEGGRAYVPPPREADHLRALQRELEEPARDWDVDAAIQLALDDPGRSGPELAGRALEYARRLQARPAEETDGTERAFHTVVSAALLVARDGSDDLLEGAEGWVRDAFAEAVSGEGDVAGSTLRGGIRFNPGAIATLGVVHLWRRGRGDERAALLELAARDDPAAAHGVAAALGVVEALDARMLPAMLRCALVAQVHPNHRWDTPEEVKVAAASRRATVVADAVAAERGWLLEGAPEPDWPALPAPPIHLRGRRGIGGAGTSALAPEPPPPADHLRTQTAAVWLRLLAGGAADADGGWRIALVDAYRGQTALANGAGHDRDADLGTRSDEWNASFLPIMAGALARLEPGAAAKWLGEVIDVPDEAFFDIAENLVPALDQLHFGDGGLDLATAQALRLAVAERLLGTRGWGWERDRTEMSVEMRIGPAIAPLFFCRYSAFSKTSCYLLPPGVDRVAPFLPLLSRLVTDGPVPFTALLTISLLEVSPRTELAAFMLGCSLVWLERQPANRDLWVDHGMGARLVAWIRRVVDEEPAAGGAASPLRSTMDDVLARLVRAGISDAHHLEAELAVLRVAG